MKLCQTLLLLFLISGFINKGQAEEFLLGAEDIPLMAGFVQLDEQNVSFDTVDGVFKSFLLQGKRSVTETDVRIFYDETLQNMGWIKVSDSIYQRDNMTLEESLYHENGDLMIQFELKTSKDKGNEK